MGSRREQRGKIPERGWYSSDKMWYNRRRLSSLNMYEREGIAYEKGK